MRVNRRVGSVSGGSGDGVGGRWGLELVGSGVYLTGHAQYPASKQPIQAFNHSSEQVKTQARN